MAKKHKEEDMPKMEPELSLDEHYLPQIKNWQVGGEYTLELEVEQVSLSKEKYGGKSEPMRARFRVKSVKAIGDNAAEKKGKIEDAASEEGDEHTKYG